MHPFRPYSIGKDSSIILSGVRVVHNTENRGNNKDSSISESKERVSIEFGVNDLDAIQEWLQSGIKEIVDSRNRAFTLAKNYKCFEVCMLLVKCGAVDLKATDELGTTPLLHAARAGELELCQVLIEAGSDVNQENINGFTALMEAARQGREEIVRILIEAGSGVNHTDILDGTALIHASKEGHEEVVRILIESGSDVNQKNDYGMTAIMRSAHHGRAQTTRILLENGADFTAKSSDGRTALDWVKDVSQNEETIELLEYVFGLHRSTLFIHAIEYLRNHRQEYEEEEVREYIPDHVMNGFFRNTIWSSSRSSGS